MLNEKLVLPMMYTAKNQKKLKYIVWLDKVSKEDVSIVGGKGANLGELNKIGMKIPRGFCVTTFAFNSFIETLDIKNKIIDTLNLTDTSDINQLEKNAKNARELLISGDIPESIRNGIMESYHKLCEIDNEEAGTVIRSSATFEDLPITSFAGQFDTYLNIKGEENIIESVKKCWASLYNSRVVSYIISHNINYKNIIMAIIIQKIINAEKSGVIFTAHPVTKDNTKIVIEAGWGFGDLIISGKVTPDTIIIDKKNSKILERHIGYKKVKSVIDSKSHDGILTVEVQEEKRKKCCLSDEEIIEISKLGKIIEEHYRYPQDVEWAIENNCIYIVQTRLITNFR